MKSIPAIDLFAGPGGLGEGFSAYRSKRLCFDVRLSIEKDPVACRTLRLRSFYRQFPSGKVPEIFYRYIKGLDDRCHLEERPEWKLACDHVKQWNLGSAGDAEGYVSAADLHHTIHNALRDAGEEWVLLGGPPCQAYSVIGRVRMTGVGARMRESDDAVAVSASRRRLEASFANDHRHTLYREYLRVVAVHQPAAFVMENVKGILSSQVPTAWDVTGHPSQYARVFDQIRKDLEDPWAALSDDPDRRKLDGFRQQFQKAKRGYRLRSFVEQGRGPAKELQDADFVVRAEQFGVPQRRHRVIVLGIREDISPDIQPLVRAARSTTVRQALSSFPEVRSALSTDKVTRQKYGKDSPVAWQLAIMKETLPVLKSANKALVRGIEEALVKLTTAKETGGKFVPARKMTTEMPSTLREFLEDPRLGGVIQHQSRSHMASDLARYLYLAVSANGTTPEEQLSPTLKAWPVALLPDHANVQHSGGKRLIGGFADRFRVQAWDRPASTVTAHIHKDGHYFIHPDPRQCRSLSVREAARLQTFPENYFFEGNKTQQFIQVGNAVPPYLALQLASVVAAIFATKENGLS